VLPSVLASVQLTHATQPLRCRVPYQPREVVAAANLVDLLLQSERPLLRLELQRGVTLQAAAAAVPAPVSSLPAQS
jgi:hypothetical protein